MKIKDLKLPGRYKLNNNFKLDDSFDVNTILLVKSFKLVEADDSGNCYEVFVTALKDDMEYNKNIAVPCWRDFSTGDYNKTIYETLTNKFDENGNFVDTLFVMEDEDVFDEVEKSFDQSEFINALFTEYKKSNEQVKPGQIYPTWLDDEQLKWVLTVARKYVRLSNAK